MKAGEILRAEKLVKEFRSGGKIIRVLDEVSLVLGGGESLAVIGPSGSGKSTLLSLLAGLDKPTGGAVVLNGNDLNALKEDDLSKLWLREIGFVFQSYYLLPALTAEENVRVPLELAGDPAAREKALASLARVGLSGRATHLPSRLSGGEQQRVALARATANNPKIIFADEPTGNLDNKTGREMEDLLLSTVKHEGASLVLVTHEAAFAQKTDRILELKDGRAVSK